MTESTLSTILRVTLQVRGLGKLTGEGPTALYDSSYTDNHIALFECQLKTPPSLSLIDNNYSEFINLHRLNFKNWKIVDIDHFMKGNSFFGKILPESDFQKDFEARMGSRESRVK